MEREREGQRDTTKTLYRFMIREHIYIEDDLSFRHDLMNFKAEFTNLYVNNEF